METQVPIDDTHRERKRERERYRNIHERNAIPFLGSRAVTYHERFRHNTGCTPRHRLRSYYGGRVKGQSCRRANRSTFAKTSGTALSERESNLRAIDGALGSRTAANSKIIIETTVVVFLQKSLRNERNKRRDRSTPPPSAEALSARDGRDFVWASGPARLAESRDRSFQIRGLH